MSIGDYYDDKAKEARELSEELRGKISERMAAMARAAELSMEIKTLQARLEQARYVGD